MVLKQALTLFCFTPWFIYLLSNHLVRQERRGTVVPKNEASSLPVQSKSCFSVSLTLITRDLFRLDVVKYLSSFCESRLQRVQVLVSIPLYRNFYLSRPGILRNA